MENIYGDEKGFNKGRFAKVIVDRKESAYASELTSKEKDGKPIAMNRLKVIPWTRYCRLDAEKDELNSKWGFPSVASE